MKQVLVNESSLQDIANAIREKTEGTEPILPSEMGNVIRAISTDKKIASGTQVGSGTQTFSVSGLEFKPSHVIIIAARNATAVRNTLAFNVGGITGHIYQNSSSQASYVYVNQSGDWSFTDNGFSVTTTIATNATFHQMYTYQWIAME